MSDATDFAALQRLTPEGAVAYLQARGRITPTFNWQDLWQDEHARQFTVSRLANADLLAALQAQITASVQGDLSRRDFIRDSRVLLQQAGWWGRNAVTDPATGEVVTTRFDNPRLALIFDTNTRMAYAAGQWERIQSTKDSHPYLRYITQRDDKVRPAHRAWDNLTLPVDDAFWSSHFPPNGWRCRCRVSAMSRRDYEAGASPTGAPLNKTPPQTVSRDWINPRTGEVTQIPVGIDPGFGYNPGQARARAEVQTVADKTSVLPAPIGAALWPQIAAAVEPAQLVAWQSMVDEALASGVGSGRTELAHVIAPAVVAALAQQGIALESAAVWLRDSDLLHALRSSKVNRQAALPEAVWRDLPRLLENADALLNTEGGELLYVIDLTPRPGKLAVRVNYNAKVRFEGKRGRIVSNFVVTGGLVDPFNLQDARYVPLR